MTFRWRVFLFTFLVFLAYGHSLSSPFIFEDIPLIVENTHIHSFLKFSEIFKPTEDTFFFPSRPFTTLSFSLNYFFHEIDVQGYRLINILLHIASALLLYEILLFTLRRERIKTHFQNQAHGLALAVSLIWMLHPLQTASVTYIAQRSQLLSSLFFLSVLFSAIQLFQTKKKKWLILAFIFCLSGTLSKAVIVTVPLVLFFYDRLFLFSSYKETIKERWPLYLSLISTWVVSLYLLFDYLGRMETSDLSVAPPIFDYLVTQGGVILHFIKLAFWPSELCFDYSWPIVTSFESVGAPCLIALFFLVVTVLLLIRQSLWSFLGIWFFLILAPTNSFFALPSPIYEYHMYLPVLSFILLNILGFSFLFHALGIEKRSQKKLSWFFSLTLLLGCGGATYFRNNDYRSSESIWLDTIQKSPANARAHDFLGRAYRDAGEVDRSIEAYKRAIQFDPSLLIAYAHLGNAYIEKRNFTEAIKYFSALLKFQSKNSKVHYNLARAYAFNKSYYDAYRHFFEAVQLNPDNFDYQIGLALTLQELGRYEDAVIYYTNALRINPLDVRLYVTFSSLLEKIPEDSLEESGDMKRLLKATNFVVEQLHMLALDYARKQDYRRVHTCLDVGLQISKRLELEDKIKFYEEEKEFYLKIQESSGQ